MLMVMMMIIVLIMMAHKGCTCSPPVAQEVHFYITGHRCLALSIKGHHQRHRFHHHHNHHYNYHHHCHRHRHDNCHCHCLDYWYKWWSQLFRTSPYVTTIFHLNFCSRISPQFLFQDFSSSGFTNWAFMTTHSWGESPIGKWQVLIVVIIIIFIIISSSFCSSPAWNPQRCLQQLGFGGKILSLVFEAVRHPVWPQLRETGGSCLVTLKLTVSNIQWWWWWFWCYCWWYWCWWWWCSWWCPIAITKNWKIQVL